MRAIAEAVALVMEYAGLRAEAKNISALAPQDDTRATCHISVTLPTTRVEHLLPVHHRFLPL